MVTFFLTQVIMTKIGDFLIVGLISAVLFKVLVFNILWQTNAGDHYYWGRLIRYSDTRRYDDVHQLMDPG